MERKVLPFDHGNAQYSDTKRIIVLYGCGVAILAKHGEGGKTSSHQITNY